MHGVVARLLKELHERPNGRFRYDGRLVVMMIPREGVSVQDYLSEHAAISVVLAACTTTAAGSAARIDPSPSQMAEKGYRQRSNLFSSRRLGILLLLLLLLLLLVVVVVHG